jgi:hypothetical protein
MYAEVEINNTITLKHDTGYRSMASFTPSRFTPRERAWRLADPRKEKRKISCRS